MKIHISEILPACDSELILTNIGSHNVEYVINLIRQLVKLTDIDKIENSTKHLLNQENISVKEVNKHSKILDNKEDTYPWQEGDWYCINNTYGKQYLRVRNLKAPTEETGFPEYAELIEITDSMLSQNGWQYKYGTFEGPFKISISANLSSPSSSKRVYKAILEDGRVLPIKYLSDIQHVLTELGNSKIVIPEDE